MGRRELSKFDKALVDNTRVGCQTLFLVFIAVFAGKTVTNGMDNGPLRTIIAMVAGIAAVIWFCKWAESSNPPDNK